LSKWMRESIGLTDDTKDNETKSNMKQPSDMPTLYH